MQRKIIQQGKGGHTIYLPKKWVDKKGLKNGDFVEISEKGTIITIGSPVKEKKEIRFEITRENRQDLKNALTHLYRRGFDSITLYPADKEIVNDIRIITKELLLGFEVTAQESGILRIENISEPDGEKYGSLLRRIFLIIKETQKILISDLETGKIQNLKTVEELMKQQDRLILFCRRILIKERYEKNPVLAWELLTFLMHIQHAQFYLYKNLVDKKIKVNQEMVSLSKELKQYFELYYDAYFRKAAECIHKINELKKELHFGRIPHLLEKSKGKEAIVFSQFRELFRLVQIGTSPIFSDIFGGMAE